MTTISSRMRGGVTERQGQEDAGRRAGRANRMMPMPRPRTSNPCSKSRRPGGAGGDQKPAPTLPMRQSRENTRVWRTTVQALPRPAAAARRGRRWRKQVEGFVAGVKLAMIGGAWSMAVGGRIGGRLPHSTDSLGFPPGGPPLFPGAVVTSRPSSPGLERGVVVQLVRIPACHAGVAGSSPVHSAIRLPSCLCQRQARHATIRPHPTQGFALLIFPGAF